jgi:hypothetical protein
VAPLQVKQLVAELMQDEHETSQGTHWPLERNVPLPGAHERQTTEPLEERPHEVQAEVKVVGHALQTVSCWDVQAANW